MRRRLLGSCLLLFGCLLLARTAAADPAPADLDRVLAGLARSAAGIETLASDFVQEKYLAVFQDALVSGGRFYYRKPDKLRWELRSPLVSGFALDGNRGRRWRGAGEKGESFDIRQDPVMKVVAEQLLAWARPDFPWLQAHYRMSLEGTAPVRLRLDPSFDTGGMIDHLLIVFAADGSHVQRVELHEKDGDYTRIRFEHTVVNGPLAAGLF
jgi:Outer membrane lipoprotein carrier protein LolA